MNGEWDDELVRRLAAGILTPRDQDKPLCTLSYDQEEAIEKCTLAAVDANYGMMTALIKACFFEAVEPF